MRLTGNHIALSLLRTSHGDALVMRLLAAAELSEEHVMIIVDQHVHGSPARKGVRIGTVDPRGWVRFFVQAGDNNSCVSARLRYPSEHAVDYAAIRERLVAASVAIKSS